MTSPALALARSPLFSQLGRLELAKLAGELEERRAPEGTVIVREGDPPDGFYVINTGQVAIVVDPAGPADGQPLTLLGAGEAFGEMALLGETPRTATVIAHTDVTLWRLSRERFEALLAHERPIARSIERALTRRLAAINHEAAGLRAVGIGLAGRALEALSPGARTLLAALRLRERWPAELLARVGERTGSAAALAELRAVPGLLHDADAGVTVDGAFASLLEGGAATGLTPDPDWLDAALEYLARVGDAAGAVELSLRVRAFDRAAALVTANEARLREGASAADLDRWLASLGTEAPAVAEHLAKLRKTFAAGAAAPTPASGARERGAPLADRLQRLAGGIAGAHFLGSVIAVAVFLVACLAPVPDGLSRAGAVALGAILATVPLLVVDVLPDYVVMLFLTVVLVVPGVVAPAEILGGFATPAWMMILTLLAVGTAISRSGLMFRLVLLSLQRLPPRFLPQSAVLWITGVLLTAGLTSGSTRVALGVPIARGIADAMGFAPRSPGAAAVGLMTFFAFLELGELFLTGTFTGLVVHDLLPAAARAEITWWRWFFIAVPPFVVIVGLTFVTLLVMFKPHRTARVNLEAVRLQQDLLGPMTRDETWSAVALVVLITGFATRDYHGIAPAWLSVGVFLLLFSVGALDRTALQGGSLGLLVYSGVILSLGNVFTTLRIDDWLTSLVKSGMPGFIANPYGFVMMVAAVAFLMHFFVPWMTASTILALVTMPIAEGLGFHPFIPVLVLLIAGDHTLVPYVNSGYPLTYYASEGELFTHEQARRPLMLEAGYRLLACLVSVPVWQLAGLM
jgi:CRP-like cAMP-binding protein/di/tricarboxylate transporter